EAAGNNGARKLKDLRKKDRTLFESLAVVARSADGKMSVKESVQGASAAAAGTLIGAVAGFPAGGPAGAALGGTAGALFGISADLLNRGPIRTSLRGSAANCLRRKVAIVAEVPENRMDDFHARIEAIGGSVVQCG